MTKRISVVLFAIVSLCAALWATWSPSEALAARQGQEFSSDYTVFTQQMCEIFAAATDKKHAQAFTADFSAFMQSADDEVKDLLIVTCERLRKLHAHAYPDYADCIDVFKKVNGNQRITGQNMKVWKEALEANLGRNSKLNNIKNFLSWTENYIIDGSISTSSGVRWRVEDPRAVTFRLNGTLLDADITETNLKCMSQNDSIEILKTAGTYSAKERKWVGTHGTITWERVGLDPSQVYATFAEYTVNMRNVNVDVDSCTFRNSNYFTEPMTGKLSHKCTSRRTALGALYPKFETADNHRIHIDNIFENVSYDGGFTQTGSAFAGSGPWYNLAEVDISRADTVYAKIMARSFTFEKNDVESGQAEIEIMVGDGKITHPGLRFRYDNSSRTMELTRGSKGTERAKYSNTFHKMNMDVELISWNIDSDHLKLGSLQGTAEKIIYFESIDFYHDDYFNQLWGMGDVHPFQQIVDFLRYNGGGKTFSARDFSRFYGFNMSDTQGLLLALSYDGFVKYYFEQDVCQVNDRLINFLQFKLGKKDYDVIRFVSKDRTPNKQFTGYLDLRSCDIEMDSVPGVMVSETKNIGLFPADGKLSIKRNRDFVFDGKVLVGLLEMEGSNFYFNYDDFRLDLDSISELKMFAEDSTRLDVYGKPVKYRIQNTLNDLSGVIQLDEPDNKSGKKDTPGYPRMNSTSPGKIYYDSPGIQHGLYKRESFYFAVDTFTFSDINHITNSNLPLTGVLTSGIFPDIRHDIVIRKDDHSFGFTMDTEAEGLPIYDGKAVFVNTIDLSNSGLRGKGVINYLNSVSESKDMFLFLPDHAEGTTKQMNIAKLTGNVQCPSVELGENQSVRDANNFQVPGQSWLSFYPQENRMDYRNSQGKFQMYPTTKRESGFECEMDGLISLGPSGLTGVGRVTMPLTVLEANAFSFTDHSLRGDTSFMAAYQLENQQLKIATGELRKNIVDGEDRHAYTEQTSEIIRRTFLNSAIREDTIMHRIERKEPKIAKKLLDRSMTSIIDFDKREGYFDFLKGGGNEVSFDPIKYKTMMTQYTWDIDRNMQTIGKKGSKGNRFVSTKERGDSLSFLVPVATYNTNTLTLTCEDVEFINVADAKVNLNKGQNVVVHEKGIIDKLARTKVEVRSDSSYHSFMAADVNIIGAKEYNGHGEYTFVDKEGGTHIIFMSDIHTDDDGITEAIGKVRDDIRLDKYFDFRGTTKIWGARQNLEFDGAARIAKQGPRGPHGYVRFDAVLDVNKIRIPLAKRSFNNYEGKGKKEDEVYKSFYITRDSTHVYSTFLETREGPTDMIMLSAPDDALLYYNNIFDRYEINTPFKMAKPDTTGSVLAYSPSDNILTGFGKVELHPLLSKKEVNTFVMRSAGDIREDRNTNTISFDVYSDIDFFLNPEIATFIYKDIMASNAPVCDSTSFRYERRRREIMDTASISIIDKYLRNAGLDPKTGLLPNDESPLFTFDNLALTWSTGKRSYVCDTTVNLMFMHYRKVDRKVRVKAEFLVKKGGGSRIRMQMNFGSDKWYYFDYKCGANGRYNRMAMQSSNKDFFQAVEGISPGDRRSRSRNTECIIGPDSYRDNFLKSFGLGNIPADPYADPDYDKRDTNGEVDAESGAGAEGVEGAEGSGAEDADDEAEDAEDADEAEDESEDETPADAKAEEAEGAPEAAEDGAEAKPETESE